jgi:hypothetical protein
LITCATDGHAATWDLTDALSHVYSIIDNSLRPRSPLLNTEKILPAEIFWQRHHQIHQSSAKSMEIAYQSEVETILVGGGDDNALSISRIQFEPIELPTKSNCATLLIPDAHASAITAIAIIPQSSPLGTHQQVHRFNFTIASSGNDQRLKLWSVSVDLSQDGVDGIEVTPKANEFSAVADISCMNSFIDIDGDEQKKSILLCGVGMDLWSVHGE